MKNIFYYFNKHYISFPLIYFSVLIAIKFYLGQNYISCL